LEVVRKIGEVKHVKVVKQPNTGECRGFAFITFETHEQANEAILKMNGMEFENQKVTVEISKRNKERAATPGVYLGPAAIKKQRHYNSYSHSGNFRYRRSRSRSRERRERSGSYRRRYDEYQYRDDRRERRDFNRERGEYRPSGRGGEYRDYNRERRGSPRNYRNEYKPYREIRKSPVRSRSREKSYEQKRY
jgi:RNA recognition motif-containing protein